MEASLKRSLAIQQNDAELLFALGDVYVPEGKINEARATARIWRDAHPDDPRAAEFETAVAARR